VRDRIITIARDKRSAAATAGPQEVVAGSR